jgi:predicted acyltransferase
MTDASAKSVVADAVPSAVATPKSARLLSLDVFRGITILGMILVNNAGSRGRQFGPLVHAEWHGWTLTDLIFPFFLFIMGTAMAFSLKRYRTGARVDAALYRKILQRTVVLLLLGLMLNLSKNSLGWLLGYGDSIHLETLRLTGVLQRIALVYLAASLIVLNFGLRAQVAIGAAILLGFWAMLVWLPNPNDYQANLSPAGNFGRVVDVALIGEAHMRDQAKTEPSDPTGLLGTLPAIVSTLIGYWAGLFIERRGLKRETLVGLVIAGIVVTGVGLAWGFAFPINKKLWTSSYVLLSGGLACICLAGCLWLFDVRQWRRLARPFEIVGINAIAAYVGAELLSVVLGTVRVGSTTVKSWLYQNIFTSNFSDERIASVGYALAIVAIWWLVLWAMARRGWSIRV